jgi:hypothetical protein
MTELVYWCPDCQVAIISPAEAILCQLCHRPGHRIGWIEEEEH